MATSAIVAVLVAIAWPSHARCVARVGRRAQTVQFMQRFYAASDSFSKEHAGHDVINQVPPGLEPSSSDSANLYDLVTLMGAARLTNPVGFTLHLVPVAGGVPDSGTLRDAC